MRVVTLGQTLGAPAIPAQPASGRESRAFEIVALIAIGAMSLGGVIAFAKDAPKVGYSLSAISTLGTTILAAARLLGE